jgi:hypothetical protein
MNEGTAMIAKANGQIRIDDNLILSRELTVSEFLASPSASQWQKRWVDSVELYTRGLLDENGAAVTVVLIFNAELLKSVCLYYDLPNEQDFADLKELSDFHAKILFDKFGNNPLPYPWYQFDWGVVRNQMSHIEVRYGVTVVHDPTLKTVFSFTLLREGNFRKRRNNGSEIS